MSYYHNPVRVYFGPGSLSKLPLVLNNRTCVLVTTGGAVHRGLLDHLKSLIGNRLLAVYMNVEPNPTIASATLATKELKGQAADVILAVGGGSVLDTAKAVAAQFHPGIPAQWLSAHLRDKEPIPDFFPSLPIVAVPTTAGTGSEVTKWATIWDDETGKKYSISHPSLYPEAAIVDPELTLTLPKEVTVSTGLDALSHAMEAIWNKNANPVSDALAMRAISIIPDGLREVLVSPDSIRARKALHYASLLAGLSFSNTRTAIAHSISYPLTSHFGLPHGIACSFTLPEILQINGAVAGERVGIIVGALGCTTLTGTVAMITSLLRDVGVPKYIQKHLGLADLADLETSLITPDRASNALVVVTPGDAMRILASALARMREVADGV